MNEHKKCSFPPLADEQCTILILGSLPGQASLNAQQYYAHPKNQFWKIMFEICDCEFSLNYETRCAMLLSHNIALWDMISSGTREGSLDSKIKNEISNDIAGFLNVHPNIYKILLNGKKAEATFKKNFHDIKIETFTMPSTSPANARMSFDQKLKCWKSAILGNC